MREGVQDGREWLERKGRGNGEVHVERMGGDGTMVIIECTMRSFLDLRIVIYEIH